MVEIDVVEASALRDAFVLVIALFGCSVLSKETSTTIKFDTSGIGRSQVSPQEAHLCISRLRQVSP